MPPAHHSVHFRRIYSASVTAFTFLSFLCAFHNRLSFLPICFLLLLPSVFSFFLSFLTSPLSNAQHNFPVRSFEVTSHSIKSYLARECGLLQVLQLAQLTLQLNFQTERCKFVPEIELHTCSVEIGPLDSASHFRHVLSTQRRPAVPLRPWAGKGDSLPLSQSDGTIGECFNYISSS